MTAADRITYRTPTWARALVYGFFLVVLVVILTGSMTKIVHGEAGLAISRNSEGFLMLLAVCFWIDVVRPRLLAPGPSSPSSPWGDSDQTGQTGRTGQTAQSRRSWAVVGLVAVVLLVGGLLLRQAPLPSRIVTLNEAVIGLAFIVPYLQLRRPVSRWAAVLPVAAVIVAAVGGSNAFTTDMAEAFGGMVLFPLVVDVIDRPLLEGRAVRARVNIAAGTGLLLLILVIHVLTPHHPVGLVPNVLYYLQRATEMFVASAVVLGYYALRRPVGVPRAAAGADAGEIGHVAGRSLT